jgi:hypothetical protein
MISIHPMTLGVAAFWTCCILIAFQCGDLSATAGTLPGPWTGVGMILGLLNVALVVVGVWFLPSGAPRIVVRVIQLVGMVGTFWSAGTLTRAIYALNA